MRNALLRFIGRIIGISLAICTIMSLAALFFGYQSFDATTGAVVPVVRKVVVLKSDPLAASDASSVAKVLPITAEQRAFYDQVAGRATAFVDHCGMGGASELDMMCEGDVCVHRPAGAWDDGETLRQYWREPMKLVFQAAYQAGYLDRKDLPCTTARDALYEGFSAPVAEAGHGPFIHCAARNRLLEQGTSADDRTAGRLCNDLAGVRGGRQIFRE